MGDICALFGLKLMYLLNMHSQAARRVQTTRTEVALEVLRLLMLH